MTLTRFEWSDFYLICFAIGFCFSFFSFVFGSSRFGKLHHRSQGDRMEMEEAVVMHDQRRKNILLARAELASDGDSRSRARLQPRFMGEGILRPF